MPTSTGTGGMRHRLIFQKLVETKDESSGDVTESWVYDFEADAEIVSGKSDEIFETQRRNALATWPQYTASETYIFRMYYRDGINSLKARILFEGKKFGIFPPVRDNRPDKMRLQAVFLNINAD